MPDEQPRDVTRKRLVDMKTCFDVAERNLRNRDPNAAIESVRSGLRYVDVSIKEHDQSKILSSVLKGQDQNEARMMVNRLERNEKYLRDMSRRAAITKPETEENLKEVEVVIGWLREKFDLQR